MPKNLKEKTIGEIESLVWCVKVGAKPAGEVWSEDTREIDGITSYINYHHPMVKYKLKNAFSGTMILFYIYDHIGKMIDEAFRVRDTDIETYHILLGYAFGIPTRNIQEFLDRTRKPKVMNGESELEYRFYED